jgi:hypothetical protein
MRKIIYTTNDGSVCVVHPVRNSNEQELSDFEIEQRAFQKLPPAAENAEFVDISAIPTDRTFRNAWVKRGNAVEHDLAKAKVIAHERRRAMREAEFKPHDEVIAKQIPDKSATEAEAARAAIRAKYDAMQSAIDAASTVEEIKAAQT